MYLHCINLRKVKEKFVLFVFFYFSTKWAEKIEENLITEHLSLGGPFFWAHPVYQQILNPLLQKCKSWDLTENPFWLVSSVLIDL